MRVVHHYRELENSGSTRRVVSIGNFDGVHIGHAEVLDAAVREATFRGDELAVLTFEPHPAELFEPSRPKMRLATLREKAARLAARDVSLVLFQKFDAEFAALDADSFASVVLVEAMRASCVLVGEGFRFGRGRLGDFASLVELGSLHGFSVITAPLVSVDGEPVSSTRIRKALLLGDVRAAARLLGRPYALWGEVVHGRKEGRALGFPTLNLGGVETLLPAPGIYAARCAFDGTSRNAALYIGDRPTTGGGFSVEAHLLDFSGDLYGRAVEVSIVEHVRGEQTFPDVGELQAQMARDVARIRQILGGDHG